MRRSAIGYTERQLEVIRSLTPKGQKAYSICRFRFGVDHTTAMRHVRSKGFSTRQASSLLSSPV